MAGHDSTSGPTPASGPPWWRRLWFEVIAGLIITVLVGGGAWLWNRFTEKPDLIISRAADDRIWVRNQGDAGAGSFVVKIAGLRPLRFPNGLSMGREARTEPFECSATVRVARLDARGQVGEDDESNNEEDVPTCGQPTIVFVGTPSPSASPTVEILSFDASSDNCRVELTWTSNASDGSITLLRDGITIFEGGSGSGSYTDEGFSEGTEEVVYELKAVSESGTTVSETESESVSCLL